MPASNVRVGPSPKMSDYRQGKRHLFIGPKRGQLFHLCASLDPRYICCSTHVVSHISNCPFECTYCFLQNYLTDTTLSVVADTRAIIEEIREKTSEQPWRLFRIGTWELGDSIGVNPLNEMAARLVMEFASLDNCILKLRTKSDQVTPLLDVDHGGRCVVSWTVNPQEVIKREEIGTAPLGKRIGAMEQVARAGYPIGLHFDPMIFFKGWQRAYEKLVEAIFNRINPKSVIWISIGSLRFNPEMKKKIENNYPNTKITSAELVLGDDNKLRYPRPLREGMYRFLLERLRDAGADECFTYLCMERPNVWQNVFGRAPRSIGHLDYLIANSVHNRFPQIAPAPPQKELYLSLEY
ncbi:MAG: hypothetical protein GXO58_10600 [Thermodesulfobacteria bacterium]|nr:hypothetical protein [Thermodesulfobacteriota bacterium]